jgi:hypothetical protein
VSVTEQGRTAPHLPETWSCRADQERCSGSQPRLACSVSATVLELGSHTVGGEGRGAGEALRVHAECQSGSSLVPVRQWGPLPLPATRSG